MNPRTRGPFRILVVDDERIIASTLRTILEQQGYEAADCFTSDEAIEKASSLLPDLLLTDIDLAGSNGAETALRIKKIVPLCQVLLISGHLMVDKWVGSLLERPDFSYLAKPFQVPTLIQKIARILSPARCDESWYTETIGLDRKECTNGSKKDQYIAKGNSRIPAIFPSRQMRGGGLIASSTASPIAIAGALHYSTPIEARNLEKKLWNNTNALFNAESRLVDALEEHCTSVFCGSASTLFAQNDSPTGVYVLHHGTVMLEMRADDGKVLVCIKVSPLSILGLSSTITNQPHRFSAIARPGSKLRFVAREHFGNIFRSSGALYPSLLQVLAKEVWFVRQAMSELIDDPKPRASRPVHALGRLKSSPVRSRIWVN